jgi:hypothetical protein
MSGLSLQRGSISLESSLKHIGSFFLKLYADMFSITCCLNDCLDSNSFFFFLPLCSFRGRLLLVSLHFFSYLLFPDDFLDDFGGFFVFYSHYS